MVGCKCCWGGVGKGRLSVVLQQSACAEKWADVGGGVRGGEGSEVLELRLCEMQMWVL